MFRRANHCLGFLARAGESPRLRVPIITPFADNSPPLSTPLLAVRAGVWSMVRDGWDHAGKGGVGACLFVTSE
jgi:hypothetical protein